MHPRLEKLIQQRDLVRDHLRWLDAEIELQGGQSPAPTTAPASTRTAPPTSVPASSAPLAVHSATTISPPAASPTEELPEVNVRGVHNDVRSGCLLYFAIAFAVVGAVIAYIYWRY